MSELDEAVNRLRVIAHTTQLDEALVTVLDALEARDKTIRLMANSLQVVGYNDVDYAKAIARAESAEAERDRALSSHESVLNLLAEHSETRDAAEAKLARISDLAESGIRFDMNPTMLMSDPSSTYSQWAIYFQRADAAWREGIRSVLNDKGADS